MNVVILVYKWTEYQKPFRRPANCPFFYTPPTLSGTPSFRGFVFKHEKMDKQPETIPRPLKILTRDNSIDLVVIEILMGKDLLIYNILVKFCISTVYYFRNTSLYLNNRLFKRTN